MKKIIAVVLLCTTSLMWGSAPEIDAFKKEGENFFMQTALDFIQSEPGKFTSQVINLRKIFFAARLCNDIDVDTILMSDEDIESAPEMTLGTYLDQVAHSSKELPDARFRAKVVLGLVSQDRSKPSLISKDTEILKALIVAAIDSPSETDVERGIVKGPDLELVQYCWAGNSKGYYDLSEIVWDENNGESLYTYFEQESKMDANVERVYSLIISLGRAKLPSHDSEGNAIPAVGSEMSGVIDLLVSALDNPDIEVAAADSVDTDEQDDPATENSERSGWRSYLTSLNVFAAGGWLWIGAFLYKKYMTESTQETDEQIAIKI